MRRREFISLVGDAAAWPFAARAQQPAVPVILPTLNHDSRSKKWVLAGVRKAG
jgi:hypothetical protein